jgi:hypothetical protein
VEAWCSRVNTDELIEYWRTATTIEDESEEYGAAGVLRLMNHGMRTVFQPMVASAREGHWLHVLTRALSVGNPLVRLHPRHIALEQIDLRIGGEGGDWAPLTIALESERAGWERHYRAAQYPQAYTLQTNNIALIPAAMDSCDLRAKFVMRPSLLVEAQDAGRVIAFDEHTITVNSMPLDRVTGQVLSGSVTIDVIEPVAWSEISLFDAPATVSGSTLTVSSSFGLGRVQVGDYVRAAQQTDWPQLDESLHITVADVAGVYACRQKDMYTRADELAKQAQGALNRWVESLSPRRKATTHMPLQHGWR